MQRYQKLIGAQVAERTPCMLSLDAQILLSVRQVNDGNLILTLVALPAGRPQSRRRSGGISAGFDGLAGDAADAQGGEPEAARFAVAGPVQDRQSASPFARSCFFSLMQPLPVRGYRLATDVAAPSPPEAPMLRCSGPDRPVLAFLDQEFPPAAVARNTGRDDEAQGESEPLAATAGATSRIEQRARALALAYAAEHADAGQERSFLQSTLYRFSRSLLGLDSEETTAPTVKAPVQDEPSEHRLSARRAVDCLTDRQRQVMVSVLAGRPNKLIAEDLHISQRTVENHRAAVMARTGATSLPALARMGLLAGLHSEPAPHHGLTGPACAPVTHDSRRISSQPARLASLKVSC